MSIEALWRVRFHSNATAQFPGGAGVVMFKGGRVFGGDSSMYYVGDYVLERSVVTAKLHVGTHTPDLGSIFGPFTEYDLELSGKVNAKRMQATGVLIQSPELRVVADLEFLAEVP